MSWTFLGKSNSYSSNDGVRVQIILPESAVASPSEYTKTLANIVRTHAIREITIEGNHSFAASNQVYLNEIKGFVKSLGLSMNIITNGDLNDKEMSCAQFCFDLDTIGIALRINAQSVQQEAVLKSLDFLNSGDLSQKEMVCFVQADTKDEVEKIFNVIRDYGIREVIMNNHNIEGIQEIAFENNIRIHSQENHDLIIAEKDGIVVCGDLNDDTKIYA